MKKIFLISLFSLVGFFLIVFLFFTVRQVQAEREIAREWESPPTIIPQLKTTSQLEIIPLYEEVGSDGDFLIGHGVSYLIRTDAATILMDIGDNPDQLEIAPFAQNMQKLGIDWNEIDRIVITHPHPDHVGGTTAWRQHTISFGELPGSMGDRLVFVPTKMAYPGAIHATIPTSPGPDVATTGVISYPEVFPFSLFEPKGSEQALVVHVEGEGLVLIVGCGHPTLEKLVERAEGLYDLPVIGVVGGLHYEGATTEDVQPHIRFLEARQPKLVALSPHDSSPQAIEAFQAAFPESYHALQVGETIQFPQNTK
jgi:7,8-dihydropterin-6-yl-methyl-4-(beta-D-ribofuranosyl)aminobenzene 5'-phosphate synthase